MSFIYIYMHTNQSINNSRLPSDGYTKGKPITTQVFFAISDMTVTAIGSWTDPYKQAVTIT